MDALKRAVGGFSAESGIWWRYNVTDDEEASFDNSEFFCFINVLELVGMVLDTYVLVMLQRLPL